MSELEHASTSGYLLDLEIAVDLFCVVGTEVFADQIRGFQPADHVREFRLNGRGVHGTNKLSPPLVECLKRIPGARRCEGVSFSQYAAPLFG